MNDILDNEKIEIEDIDLEKLKKDILSYYKTAIFGINPIARIDYDRVNEITDPEELIQEAIKIGIDINKYMKSKLR